VPVLPFLAPVVALEVAELAELAELGVEVDDCVGELVVPDELVDEDASLDNAWARVSSSVARVL
jgi:hypothetical protein